MYEQENLKQEATISMTKLMQKMRQAEKNGDKLLVSISDTGVGIKTKHMPSIFKNIGLLGGKRQ